MKINIVITDACILKDLVEHSALTIEGLNLDSVKTFVAWVNQHTPLKRKDVYITTGALANREWGLHDSNAYPDNINLVSIKLDDMEDFNKIVIPRFQVGARWMDDIHDNNVRR